MIKKMRMLSGRTGVVLFVMAAAWMLLNTGNFNQTTTLLSPSIVIILGLLAAGAAFLGFAIWPIKMQNRQNVSEISLLFDVNDVSQLYHKKNEIHAS